jgi:hypothetical protein
MSLEMRSRELQPAVGGTTLQGIAILLPGPFFLQEVCLSFCMQCLLSVSLPVRKLLTAELLARC